MQTYNELFNEIQYALYSKEFMDIYKESLELELQESYIDNQLYLKENINNFINKNKLSSIINTINTDSQSLFKKIWKFFKRLLSMISNFIISSFDYMKNIFNSNEIKKASKLLSSAVNYSESTKFTESMNNDIKNRIFQTFVKSYKKAAKKYTNRLLDDKQNGLRKIFDKLKIFYSNDKNKIDINDFFADKIHHDSDYINQARLFIEILNSMNGSVMTYIIDDDNFMIMPMELYIETLNDIRININKFSKDINLILSKKERNNNIVIMLCLIFMIVLYNIPDDFYLQHIKLINHIIKRPLNILSIYSGYLFISQLIIKKNIKKNNLKILNNKLHVHEFSINLKYFNNHLGIDFKEFSKLSDNVNIENIKYLEKFIKDIPNIEKINIQNKSGIFTRIKNFFYTKYKKLLMKAYQVDEVCLDEVYELYKNKNYTKTSLFSLYCNIGVNITALYNASITITNIILSMVNDIIKVND